MSGLIEANEFGDWLIGEISARSENADFAGADPTGSAVQDLEELIIAKKVLLEFLTLQQSMFDTACESRGFRSSEGMDQ